ncbi:arylsulfatase [Prolixibacter sp. SD074]|uniref:arylsulfatase n=1 Tax=Prolixibacter sp. SD074 TaxID=2652391 RepID=UPI0012765F65|nr:arylsulfatase [Prolixibacter sp. SD074]GET28033.1 arylsulfatase [Prolixibacter sp. SD074]
MNHLKTIPLLALGGLIFSGCTSDTKKVDHPNILLIMLDDSGYSDLGCYGGEIQTPNINQLASKGVRFTQMHNCARCCPTRASLLTGLYAQTAGINGMGVNLNRNAATIAEVLKDNGYHTGMAGKWHLSQTKPLPNHNEQLRWLAHRTDHGPFAPLWSYPCNRGFEEHWGVIWGVVDYYDPFSLVHNEEPIKTVPDTFYMTDFITQKSIEMLDSYRKDNRPFFLYVAEDAPHWPLMAPEKDIAKYQDTYKDGWEVLRRERYRRMVQMGLIDSTTYPLPANSSGRSWADCKKKAYESACMSVHAAMVDHVDQGVGKIIAALKKNGQYENTIIFVLSDNGASYERGYPPGFDRPGFTRDSTIIEYNSDHPGTETTWDYIGRAWASASNTPFRYWKKESYEGGSATPFIIHWPARLSGLAGTLNRGVAHVIDILPTCLDVAGAAYPDSINGEKTPKLEGKSLMPLILAKTKVLHDTLYWEHEGGRAIRIGDWKMSALPRHHWELFNLTSDHTETHDLSAKYPEKVKEMNQAWEKWAVSEGIISGQ